MSTPPLNASPRRLSGASSDDETSRPTAMLFERQVSADMSPRSRRHLNRLASINTVDVPRSIAAPASSSSSASAVSATLRAQQSWGLITPGTDSSAASSVLPTPITQPSPSSALPDLRPTPQQRRLGHRRQNARTQEEWRGIIVNAAPSRLNRLRRIGFTPADFARMGIRQIAEEGESRAASPVLAQAISLEEPIGSPRSSVISVTELVRGPVSRFSVSSAGSDASEVPAHNPTRPQLADDVTDAIIHPVFGVLYDGKLDPVVAIKGYLAVDGALTASEKKKWREISKEPGANSFALYMRNLLSHPRFCHDEEFKQKNIAFLRRLADDKPLRNICFGNAPNYLESCEDRLTYGRNEDEKNICVHDIADGKLDNDIPRLKKIVGGILGKDELDKIFAELKKDKALLPERADYIGEYSNLAHRIKDDVGLVTYVSPLPAYKAEFLQGDTDLEIIDRIKSKQRPEYMAGVAYVRDLMARTDKDLHEKLPTADKRVSMYADLWSKHLEQHGLDDTVALSPHHGLHVLDQLEDAIAEKNRSVVSEFLTRHKAM
jgi:hypothetical protein